MFMKIDGSANFNQQYQPMSQENESMKRADIGMESIDGNQNKQENFPGEGQLVEAIEKSNKDFKMDNKSLQFSIHEKTKQIMVKVIDNDTEEVVREIPSEKILDMVAAMMERTGLFLDKKA
ncbi:MAG: flagellar protein FlaG [Marinisporobacter sp.]|jgi:flagellar protein FlaG|nr:flagellar protein FlaG [Marinisporobacter sp.]